MPIGRGQPMAAPPRPADNKITQRPPPHPSTPNAAYYRGSNLATANARPPPDQNNRPQPGNVVKIGDRVLNQPGRLGQPGPPMAPLPRHSGDDMDGVGLPPQGAGFFSARAAAAVIPDINVPVGDGPPPPLPTNLATFDPYAESPSIKRTAGVDQKRSGPVSRDVMQPSGSQAHIAAATPTTGLSRPNVVNPQLDMARRIGAPGSPSPMANRGQYKPPSMKRPVESLGGLANNDPRTPLVDLPANDRLVTSNVSSATGDVKRQRLSG